jgi:hypothetical protein
MKEVKIFELYDIFLEFQKGKKAKDIANKFNLSTSNMSYYTKKLKDLNILRYDGKGVWTVVGDYSLVQKSVGTRSDINLNSSRGHAFIWKVELTKELRWKELLEKKKIKYRLQSNGKVIRIIFENKKIWLTKKGMIIYEPSDFFGRHSYEAKGLAVYSMDLIIKKLLKKLNISFFPYRFTTSREHFGLVKNELARQFNSRGEKLHIKNESGTEWLWIDDSLGLGELETNNVDTNKQVQDFWNDNKKHKFQVTPSFILNTMNGIQQNQLIFDKNMQSHLSVLDKLGTAVDELRKEISSLKKGN